MVFRQQAAEDAVTHFATGVAVFRDGKLLVVRRVADDFLGGLYELPGGGVDDGETIAQGAVRELLEETGLSVTEIVSEFAGFDYATKTKPRVRQINYKVLVAPGEVVLEPTEHDEYRWITATDIEGLHTSDLMRDCLRAAFAA